MTDTTPPEMSMTPEQQRRYEALAHALQSGVAQDHGAGSRDGEPKFLRVGVNMSLIQNSAIVRLLVSKGLFTWDEYYESLLVMMQREKEFYEARLSASLGVKVTLI